MRTVPTAAEIRYIAVQRLGRLATIGRDGYPQVKPVSCYYNTAFQTIDIGGQNMAGSQKYRNAQSYPRVAVVLDDMAADGDPAGSIRCVEIRGTAEVIHDPSNSAARAPGAIIRIHPSRIISWEVESVAVPPGSLGPMCSP